MQSKMHTLYRMGKQGRCLYKGGEKGRKGSRDVGKPEISSGSYALSHSKHQRESVGACVHCRPGKLNLSKNSSQHQDNWPDSFNQTRYEWKFPF